MKIEYCGICDKGKVRKINQDAVFMDAKGDVALFAVADGMGGHQHGEVASSIIVAEMEKYWKELGTEKFTDDFKEMVDTLRQRLQLAHSSITERCNACEVCGSTVVVLFIYKGNYCIFSSGDSRIYYLNRWSWKQLTVDDVWENQPEITMCYSPEQLRQHQNYGKLIHALGVEKNAAIRGKTDILKKGDHFLLCSDGFYKMCAVKNIRKILRNYQGCENGEESLKQIIRLVYESGATDNVSVILVRIV